jgi:hypothetical protein
LDIAAENPGLCAEDSAGGSVVSKRPSSVPTYRKHKASGQAIVTLTDGLGGRRDVLLGKYGTKESRQAYARVIAEWEAGGRRLPGSAADLTVNELLLRYWAPAALSVDVSNLAGSPRRLGLATLDPEGGEQVTGVQEPVCFSDWVAVHGPRVTQG